MTVDQLDLLEPAPVAPAHLVRSFAGTLAAFRWPGATGYDALPAWKRDAAEAASRQAIEALLALPDTKPRA